MSGHLQCTATLSMSRHISTLNYLGSADTCLTRTVIYWLSVPAVTDSANMPRFRWSFQPKIASGALPKLWPTVRSNFHAAIWWPQTIFHIESMRAWCQQLWTTWLWPFGYIRFTTPRRKSLCVWEAIRSLVKPAMSKKRTILSFCPGCRALGIELCGKTQRTG